MADGDAVGCSVPGRQRPKSNLEPQQQWFTITTATSWRSMIQIASRSDHYCSTRHYSLCLYLLEVVQNVEALQKVLNLDLLGQRHDVLLKNSPDKLRIDLVPADARIPPRADSLIHVGGALCSLCGTLTRGCSLSGRHTSLTTRPP